MRLLVFSLMGQVGVHRYLVALRDGQDVAVAAARLDGPQPQRELLRPLLSLRRPARLEELEGKQYEDARRLLGEAGLRMVVPMQLQDQNRGFILVGEKMSREAFTEEDDEFLGSLAALAIVSIENARLFKEAIEKQRLEDELAIARDIQKGLLPSVLPRLEGIDLAAANISSKQVGGEYYDVFPVGESRPVIAIGDVSGKGYPAALYTCYDRCPQDVQLSSIMTALKNIAAREGYIHPSFKEQTRLVSTFGRLYEVEDFDNKKREKLGLPPIQKTFEDITKLMHDVLPKEVKK